MPRVSKQYYLIIATSPFCSLQEREVRLDNISAYTRASSHVIEINNLLRYLLTSVLLIIIRVILSLFHPVRSPHLKKTCLILCHPAESEYHK